ncbi:hypothetical protein [Hymenobacter sp. YC55]|uniref:hypothetical protein n=1 Tax=Hymenobacter sp. YC55 TaxID=3034019 RepID=UPI0023F7920B|nr:hypothetical protein [Hymenobacter sp. YC55]
MNFAYGSFALYKLLHECRRDVEAGAQRSRRSHPASPGAELRPGQQLEAQQAFTEVSSQVRW